MSGDIQVWGWDTETHLFSPQIPYPKPVCHSFSMSGKADDRHATYLTTKPHAIETILHEESVILVAHNAQYDVLCTAVHHPDLVEPLMKAVNGGRILCTKLLETLRQGEQDSFGGTSLADCAYRYLGSKVAKGSDTWRLRYSELDGIPVDQWPADAREYALKDAVLVRDLFLALAPQVESIENLPAQTAESVALGWMRQWGMPVCQERSLQLAVETELKRRVAFSACQAHGLIRDNKAQSVDTKLLELEVERSFRLQGKEAPRTPSGKVKRDAPTLESLGQRTPILQAHTDYSRANKFLATYALPLYEAGKHGRLHPDFRSLVATGRTSISKPPMQQIPRSGGIRECIRATEGRTLVIADYSGAELRGLGQTMLDFGLPSPMAELFQADPHADAHADFGAQLLGVSPAVMDTLLAEEDPGAKDARQEAKAANFGFPGGMGVLAFVAYQAAQGRTFTPERARQLRCGYIDRWKMKAFFDYVKRQIDIHGGIQLPRSKRWRRGRFPQCANYCFQGPIADVAKLACRYVVRECLFGELQSAHLIHFVHDELIVEVPEDVSAAYAVIVSHLMEQAAKELMPDVPMIAEPKVSKCWTK